MLRMVLASALLAVFGCSSTEPLRPVNGESSIEVGLLLSTVHVADPRAASQLVDGFHQLEGGSWRWTKRAFTVRLEPPPPVPLHEPSLALEFSVPEVTIESLGSVTVSATLNGYDLGSMTVTEPGQNIIFDRPVPAALLEQEPLEATFHLKEAMEPTPQDERELGIIAISIALM